LVSGFDSLIQTVALQLYAMLILATAKEVGLRCTDTERFAPLMLVLYYQVDMTQTFLFLQERAFSVAFFEMIAVQEAASIAKNSGLVSNPLHISQIPILIRLTAATSYQFELLLWFLRLRKTNPYADPENVRVLKAKCLVDTMSEVLACFACFTYYVTEHLASSLDFATTYTITYLNGTTGNYTTFVSPGCRATCVGYQYGDLAPAEPETRSISKLFGVCKN
jgi:hypothetical protein